MATGDPCGSRCRWRLCLGLALRLRRRWISGGCSCRLCRLVFRWLSRPRRRVRPVGNCVSDVICSGIMLILCGSSYLVRWVCPRIAEVEVQVEALASCLGSLRELQVVVQIVVAIFRVDPESLSD